MASRTMFCRSAAVQAVGGLRMAHRKSVSVGESAEAASSAALSHKDSSKLPERKLMFVHFRLNNVPCRVTYKVIETSYTVPWHRQMESGICCDACMLCAGRRKAAGSEEHTASGGA